MEVIPQRELRNHSGEVLRRAEAGERFTVTISGRPVAELGPPQRKQWVSRQRLRQLVATPAPESLLDDLYRSDSSNLEDPFTR